MQALHFQHCTHKLAYAEPKKRGIEERKGKRKILQNRCERRTAPKQRSEVGNAAARMGKAMHLGLTITPAIITVQRRTEAASPFWNLHSHITSYNAGITRCCNSPFCSRALAGRLKRISWKNPAQTVTSGTTIASSYSRNRYHRRA